MQNPEIQNAVLLIVKAAGIYSYPSTLKASSNNLSDIYIYLAASKSFSAVREAFSNAYRDKDVPSQNNKYINW
jgi:hypothetical protein